MDQRADSIGGLSDVAMVVAGADAVDDGSSIFLIFEMTQNFCLLRTRDWIVRRCLNHENDDKEGRTEPAQI
jgi:hypothetical protein